jgi:hypothetical protein
MGNILWPVEPGTHQYRATYYYEDRHQGWADGCNGVCEEQEIKTDTMWIVIRCLYCHTHLMSCRHITQKGTRCRREASGDAQLCSHHSNVDFERLQREREERWERHQNSI